MHALLAHEPTSEKKAVIAAMEQLSSSIVPFGGMLMAAILFDSCQNCRANTGNSKEMILLFYFTFIVIAIIFFLFNWAQILFSTYRVRVGTRPNT